MLPLTKTKPLLSAPGSGSIGNSPVNDITPSPVDAVGVENPNFISEVLVIIFHQVSWTDVKSLVVCGARKERIID